MDSIVKLIETYNKDNPNKKITNNQIEQIKSLIKNNGGKIS